MDQISGGRTGSEIGSDSASREAAIEPVKTFLLVSQILVFCVSMLTLSSVTGSREVALGFDCFGNVIEACFSIGAEKGPGLGS